MYAYYWRKNLRFQKHCDVSLEAIMCVICYIKNKNIYWKYLEYIPFLFILLHSFIFYIPLDFFQHSGQWFLPLRPTLPLSKDCERYLRRYFPFDSEHSRRICCQPVLTSLLILYPQSHELLVRCIWNIMFYILD